MPSAIVRPWRRITKPCSPFGDLISRSQASIQRRMAADDTPCDSGVALSSGAAMAAHAPASARTMETQCFIVILPSYGLAGCCRAGCSQMVS